jgi:hypothetical protein
MKAHKPMRWQIAARGPRPWCWVTPEYSTMPQGHIKRQFATEAEAVSAYNTETFGKWNIVVWDSRSPHPPLFTCGSVWPRPPGAPLFEFDGEAARIRARWGYLC